MKSIKVLFVLLFTVFISCKNTSSSISDLEKVETNLKQQFAPDKRVKIFDIQFENKNNTLVLKGETTTKKAFNMLIDSLKRRSIAFKNEVRILPDSAVGDKKYALGNNSVINIRSQPKHSAELGTQGLLGMELKVLDKKGSWYRVQTPDNYISWVDGGGIERMTAEELQSWNTKNKLIYTKNSGYVYEQKSENSTRVSDIVFGGILAIKKEYDSYYEVEYPDGRNGFVKKADAVLYNSWLKKNPANAEFIEESAKTMLGVPYLWGGTSTKGNDCSGFTKTVYLMNGFVIPRDASQQVTAGKIVDENLKFEGLEKGDLMFFGTPAKGGKKQRVTHVGIWLGNGKGEFIHSASNVHLSSINDSEKHYDGFNKNRYLGSRRYLGVKDDKIIDLKKSLQIKP
ncbi:Gamma-D-glutamyl-L-lysine dipeptidyl-peptidase [Polaribacter huanghezhanensis]|uniref:C40 family peptidase n=1 Tax=Polaribacter huanghezhanensis TaxID=1354726 RepID=UPI0026478260|nr:C40 family peptidase [Polaribacter huanghezhanensis]WKD84837.1 Gamma-D-glutamyl-L-lysine dipeptidyl-peptidase [Polaribacter huanghezhanensis]